ncbi:TetR/AcrR family transcriptional regulator [Georgenia sp. Z1344]|uniref:TetR/AcrR family transcriptional regulator n=1 Tax=Georgenia sp. Z1344 TaxID=3416706 RepID=UPI003CF017DC
MADARDGRHRLAEALTRVVAREGITGVSVRAVAAEAGVSGGAVQHHFRTRAEMIRFAMEWISDGVEHRLSRVARWGDVEEWTREILLELLPLDEQRQREHAVWLAFVAHAATDPSLADLRNRTNEKLLEMYARIVRARRSLPPTSAVEEPVVTTMDGQVDDVDEDAMLLQALLDGLSLHLTEMQPDEAQRRGPALLDRFLELVVDISTPA